MKRWIIVAGLGAGAVCALLAVRRRQAGVERPTMWDKMRQHMEDMPEDFPPRVMFDNVERTRTNTERILEILEQEGFPHDADKVDATA